MPQPETLLSHCARLHLAEDLGVDHDELEYTGIQEGLSYRLVLFTVDRPGHPLHRTTRSVKVMV